MPFTADQTKWLQANIPGIAKQVQAVASAATGGLVAAPKQTPAEAKAAAADKKKHEADQKKEAALVAEGARRAGLVEVNVSLMIENARGDFVRDLKVWGNATGDKGEDGVIEFKESGGAYLALKQYIPCGGALSLKDLSTHLEVEFGAVRYPNPKGGKLHLKAVERARKGEKHDNRGRSWSAETEGKSGFDVGVSGELTEKTGHSTSMEQGESQETSTGTGHYDVTVEA